MDYDNPRTLGTALDDVRKGVKMLFDAKYKIDTAMIKMRARGGGAGLFRRYSEISARAGFDKLYFILSFDCDTDEDIETVECVQERLAGMGVTPVYAVSGPLLKKGSKTFEKIAGSGAEFINHGFSPHAFFNDKSGRYECCFFYDQLTLAEVAEDIEKGGEVVREVTGSAPAGYRVPHFGTFQQPGQLKFLHRKLKELGYRYSSSTMPMYGFLRGAVYYEDGIAEFPVSGMWSKPLSVLDTWEFLKLHNRTYADDDYISEANAVAGTFKQNSHVGILNYYADPSHVAEKDVFFKAVEVWKSIAEVTTYSRMLDKLERDKKQV